MLLLHISDIHFREPDCCHLDTDPDQSFRTNLMRDVRAKVAELGSIDGILVGGDIAYKGHPKEYEAATDWLKKLAQTCRCDPKTRVFVVPGNHDVDREIVRKQPSVQNAHAAIAGAKPDAKERTLRTQFNNPDTGKALLLPLAAYNEFAKFSGCQVYTPDHLFWKQDVPIDDRVHLRIYGLTSILISGQNGNDDKRDALYVSPLQTVLDTADDVVNLVLIHHPPDWLMDGEPVDDAFCARAGLHLLGHKHKQRLHPDERYIRYSAAAVIPGREERNVEPGYNIIELTVEGEGPARRLRVRSRLQRWRNPPENRFDTIGCSPGKPYHEHWLDIPAPPMLFTTATQHVYVPPTADTEAAMGTEENRNLIYRFWQLTMSQRRAIVVKLKLLEDAELTLPEPERYGRALLRASERDQIDALSEEIRAREKI
jgi:predicted MPP superfamily phosphohydrolase